MNNMPSPVEAVTFSRTAESPPQGGENSLLMRLVGGGGVAGPIVLHGSYNIGVDVTGRYSGRMPMPVRVVAVARETGRVHSRLLMRSDDQPPSYLGDAAPPAVTRNSPGGPSSAGITESGYFSVDLKRHLSWPDAAGEFDVFLWLERITSEVVHLRKAAEPGSNPGAAEFERPTRVALVTPSPSAAGPSLAKPPDKGLDRGARHILGTGGRGRTSILAYALESGAFGWTVVGTDDSGPVSFAVDVARLLPAAGARDRVYAFAVGAGKRSDLLVLPPLR